MNFSVLTSTAPSLTGILAMVLELFTSLLSMIGLVANAAMQNAFLALPIVTSIAIGAFVLFKKMCH